MSALTARVSAALRAARLPVLRYSTRSADRDRVGIRVGNYDARTGACVVFVNVYTYEGSDTRDDQAEQELSDQARAVLLAKGFEVSSVPGGGLLTVRNGTRAMQEKKP